MEMESNITNVSLPDFIDTQGLTPEEIKLLEEFQKDLSQASFKDLLPFENPFQEWVFNHPEFKVASIPSLFDAEFFAYGFLGESYLIPWMAVPPHFMGKGYF